MHQPPTVSVLIPSHNYARYLPLAVSGALSQTYRDLEVVIVDDCSTDESREVAEECRRLDDRVVTIFHSRNRGLAATRNTALAHSSGKFIALCDADDIWLANKLTVQLECFRRKEALGVVYSDGSIIDADGHSNGQRFSQLFHRKKQKTSGDLFDELCRRNFICVPSVLLRREAILYAGGFDEALRSLEDWVCWAKISTKYHFQYIPETLVQYRMHRASLSHDSAGMARNRIQALHILLESLSQVPPGSLSAMLYSLGMSHLEIGETREALLAFRKSVRAHPLQLRGWARVCQACARALRADPRVAVA